MPNKRRPRHRDGGAFGIQARTIVEPAMGCQPGFERDARTISSALVACCRFTTFVLKTSLPFSSVTRTVRCAISSAGRLRPNSAAIAKATVLASSRVPHAVARSSGKVSPLVRWKKKLGMSSPLGLLVLE